MHALQMILQAVVDDSGALIECYSGHGMYRGKCLAIVGTQMQVADLLSKAIRHAVTNLSDMAGVKCDDTNQLYDLRQQSDQLDRALQVVFHHYQDMLGRHIVIYWPSVDFEG